MEKKAKVSGIRNVVISVNGQNDNSAHVRVELKNGRTRSFSFKNEDEGRQFINKLKDVEFNKEIREMIQFG
jgi:hypothetical protein